MPSGREIISVRVSSSLTNPSLGCLCGVEKWLSRRCKSGLSKLNAKKRWANHTLLSCYKRMKSIAAIARRHIATSIFKVTETVRFFFKRNPPVRAHGPKRVPCEYAYRTDKPPFLGAPAHHWLELSTADRSCVVSWVAFRLVSANKGKGLRSGPSTGCRPQSPVCPLTRRGV